MGFSPAQATALRDVFIERYALALSNGKAYWLEGRTTHGLIHELLDGLSKRSRKDFLNARTEVLNGQRQFKVDGKRAMAISRGERAKVRAFMKAFAKTQPHPDFFKVLDVVVRIAGTGSLGVDRYAVLVEGKGSPDSNYILDLKAALPSAVAQHVKTQQPRWPSEAHRIVAVQTMMQAVPMAFLHAVEMDGRPFVLRGLQPSEDRVSLDDKDARFEEVTEVIAQMAQMLAWAQLRSSGRSGAASADELIAFGQATKWRSKMAEAAGACAAQCLRDARAFQNAHEAMGKKAKP